MEGEGAQELKQCPLDVREGVEFSMRKLGSKWLVKIGKIFCNILSAKGRNQKVMCRNW